MTTQSQCQFWDCHVPIPKDHFLCSTKDHYAGYKAGTIDQCAACGQYKDAKGTTGSACCRQRAGTHQNRKTDTALLEELRSLRSCLARSHRLHQDFMVFGNETLEQMATVRPTTPEAMLTINGVGPVKMKRFGSDFLQLIREHSGTNTDQKNPETPRSSDDVQLDSNQQPAANSQIADPRTRYAAEYRTSDGHYVRSRAEFMIDDWLFNHGIAHAYERKLPIEESVISDFYIPQGDVYIEFWGKEDDPTYAKRMAEKQTIYANHSINLISLTDAVLYRLDDHMPSLLRRYGVSLTG